MEGAGGGGGEGEQGGLAPEYKEAARAISHSPHNAAGRAPARLAPRLHFGTFSKLGNCIKSDLYLSVAGAPRSSARDVRRRGSVRDSARALTSISSEMFNKSARARARECRATVSL